MGNLFCCVQVEESKVGIKERFGKHKEVLEPGFHCVPWIFGYQIRGKLSLRVQQLDVRCETKTKVSFECFDLYEPTQWRLKMVYSMCRTMCS